MKIYEWQKGPCINILYGLPFSLQLNAKEDALVKFKSELGVMELEIQVQFIPSFSLFMLLYIVNFSWFDIC